MKEIFELKDTAELMTSSDYKERFVAEYYQIKIRCMKLKDMLDKWERGELGFTPTCSRQLLESQFNSMSKYKSALKIRAGIEGIELNEK